MRAPTFARWANLAALLIAVPVCAETLQDAVVQTLATSPDVLIEASRRLAVEEAVSQSRGGFLPRADIALGRGRQRPENQTTQQTYAAYGGSLGQIRNERSLTISQMLWDGAQTAADVTRNRARTDSAAHKVASTSEQTALRAVENYLEVLRNQSLLALTQDNVLVHQRTFDQIKLRAAAGVGRKADLDQIEARLALAQSNLRAAEANLRVAEINYRLVIGTRPGTLAAPTPPDNGLMPKTPDDAVEVALENHRLLRSARSDIEAAIAQNQGAKAAMSPRLDIELGLTKNNSYTDIDATPDYNRSAMLKFRYNLFRGGSDKARIAETQFQIREAEEIARRTERQIEQSVRLSWNAYTSAAARLPYLNKHAEASQVTRDAYTKQFSLGQRTLLDLLDAENEAFTASSNQLNGRFVELFSRYRVLADLGMLLSTLGVAQRDEAEPLSH